MVKSAALRIQGRLRWKLLKYKWVSTLKKTISSDLTTNIVESKDIFDDVKTCSIKDVIKKLYIYIGEDIDQEFLYRVTNLSVNQKIVKDISDFKIVFIWNRINTHSRSIKNAWI